MIILNVLVKNQQVKVQRRRSKQKVVQHKKEEPNDYLAIQNRLATDLSGHNWLVERLMQQHKIGAEDISVKRTAAKTATKQENEVQETETQRKEIEECEKKDGNETDIKESTKSPIRIATPLENKKVDHSQVTTEERQITTEEQLPVVNSIDNKEQLNKVEQNENCTAAKKTISVNTDDSEVKTSQNQIHASKKCTVSSTLLMSMLDPRKSNPQLSSPTRINPPLSVVSSKYPPLLPKNILTTSVPPTLIKSPTHVFESPTHVIKCDISTSSTSSTTISSNPIPFPINISSTSEAYDKEPPLLLPGNKRSLNTVASVYPNSYTHSASAPPDNKSLSQVRHSVPQRRTNSETSASEKQKSYQPLRSNLVVMTRNESNITPNGLRSPSNYSRAYPIDQQVPYSKMIVEERYNRKRPHGMDDKSVILNMENRKVQLHRDLDSRMSEIQRIPGDRNNARIFIPPTLTSNYRDNQIPHSPQPEPRLKFNLMSRFPENGVFDQSHKSGGEPMSTTRLRSADLLNAQTQYINHRDSSSSFICPTESIEDKGRFAVQDMRTDIESNFQNHMKTYAHQEVVHDPMHRQLSIQHSRERENRLIEEARARQEHQRSENARKQNPYALPIFKNAGNYRGIPRPSTNDPYGPINERVRTVEDLRALHMGVPIETTIRQYNRTSHALRNDRLTEREKLVLRDAEISSHHAIRQESIASRQTIHNAYLEHARREGNIHGPVYYNPTQPHQSITNEQVRLLALQEKEEERREQENQTMNGFSALEERELRLSSHNEVRCFDSYEFSYNIFSFSF